MIYRNSLICFMILIMKMSSAIAEDLPYSNAEALHSSAVVFVGQIQFKGEVDMRNSVDFKGETDLVTEVEFLVTDNLGNDAVLPGDHLKVLIPQSTLKELDQHENGPLLAQSSDILLGFDFVDTDQDFNPTGYKIKTKEYVVIDNNLSEVKNWMDSLLGADTPTLNQFMVEEWRNKGFDSEKLATILEEDYQDSLNQPLDPLEGNSDLPSESPLHPENLRSLAIKSAIVPPDSSKLTKTLAHKTLNLPQSTSTKTVDKVTEQGRTHDVAPKNHAPLFTLFFVVALFGFIYYIVKIRFQ